MIGGVLGLLMKKPLSTANQSFFKTALGAFTVFYGLRLTWLSLGGTFLQMSKQLLIVVLALALGKVTGRLLCLQQASNRLGQFARASIERHTPPRAHRLSEGFNTCTVLFCAAPLAVLGAVPDGLSDYYQPLIIKAVMDGLATMAFATTFGWGVILSALPVLVWQGTLTLLAYRTAPFLSDHGLSDSINAAGGLLIFSVALVMLGLKKIELADYLPSLACAPLITWLWR
jgi:hypothetical protein